MASRQQQQQLQLVSQAVISAQNLDRLLQQPPALQQLQQPPAASPPVEQEQLIARCLNMLQLHIDSLNVQSAPFASNSCPEAAAGLHRMLSGVLRCKAARSAGVLLAWTLQQPELLQLGQLQDNFAKGEELVTNTTSTLWLKSSECLVMLNLALIAAESVPAAAGRCTEETLAAAMLQQLEQSGRAFGADRVPLKYTQRDACALSTVFCGP
jgi:hypothetical protein